MVAGPLTGGRAEGACPANEAIRRCDRLPRMGGPYPRYELCLPDRTPSARQIPLPLGRKTRYAIAPALLLFLDAPYVITPLDFGNTATDRTQPARVTIPARP